MYIKRTPRERHPCTKGGKYKTIMPLKLSSMIQSTKPKKFKFSLPLSQLVFHKGILVMAISINQLVLIGMFKRISTTRFFLIRKKEEYINKKLTKEWM